jgi:hypothetical protein
MDRFGRPTHSLESQLSKRKHATASKRVHSPKIAAKAQRAAQAIVRSPKDRRRSVGAGPTESPPKRHDETPHHSDTPQEALPVENPVVENSAPPLQDNCKQTMTDHEAKKRTNFSSATANVRAYQAKLLEMAQANMEFSFESAQRLATIRSPVEFPSVIAELTGKRIAMFWKHSTEWLN